MWKIIALAGAVLVGGLATWLYLSGEPERELNAVMQELSVRTAADLSQKLPRIQNIEDVLLVPVVGGRDEDNRLEELIIDAVADSRKYTIHTWDGIRDKLENGSLWEMFVDKVGLIGNQPPKTVEQANEAAKQLALANYDLDGVVIVKGIFDQGPRDDALGAKVELTAQFYDISQNKALTDKTVVATSSIDSAWNRLYLTHKIDGYGLFTRFILWIVLSALFPWIGLPVLRPLLRRKENAINASVLGLFTVIDVLLAWVLLMAVTEVGLGGVLFLVVIAGVAGYYNYDAVDFMDRRLL